MKGKRPPPDLRKEFAAIQQQAHEYFDGLAASFSPSEQSATDQGLAHQIAQRVRQAVNQLAQVVNTSPLVNKTDFGSINQYMKSMASALRLSQYQCWPAHAEYDEDTYRGWNPGGESEFPVTIDEARSIFDDYWKKAEAYLDMLNVPQQDSRGPALTKRVTAGTYRGPRNQDVARRQAELRNIVKPRKPNPRAIDVCKRWDSQNIPLPETYTDVKTWIEAYKQYRGKVAKLISTDISKVRRTAQ